MYFPVTFTTSWATTPPKYAAKGCTSTSAYSATFRMESYTTREGRKERRQEEREAYQGKARETRQRVTFDKAYVTHTCFICTSERFDKGGVYDKNKGKSNECFTAS